MYEKKDFYNCNYNRIHRLENIDWLSEETKAIAIEKLDAPACLRVNVNLAQFDGFYETYDITEGDNIYTAPEDRLRVW